MSGLRAVALLAALVLPVAGCGGSSSNKSGGAREQTPTMLTMAGGYEDPVTESFASEAARLSGGTIRIDVRNRWRIGQRTYENGLIRDVEVDKADLGWAGSRAFDSVGVYSLRALAAPLLIDSYALQQQVVESPIIAEMLQGLGRIGLVGLGVLPGPMRKPLGITRPLVKPSDYAGLTIGVQQSRVADTTMRVLGAKPVWFPAMGDITDSGFGGIEQQVGSIQGHGYDTIGHYLTANVNLWPRPLVFFANRKVFESLSANEQDALRRAAANVVPSAIAANRQDDRDNGATLCRRGLVRFVTASPDDLAALRRAVQPVYDELVRDPQTKRFVERIEAMRRKLAAPPDAVRCANALR